MLKLTIEHKLCGPLAHPPTRKALEEAVATSNTIEDAAEKIQGINGLAIYWGGSHIAVHSIDAGTETLSFTRWAIVIEEG